MVEDRDSEIRDETYKDAQNVEWGWMAHDNVTSHFSTMLETIASASFLSSLSIIHVASYSPRFFSTVL